MVHAARHFDPDQCTEGGGQAADGQDQERGLHRALFGLCPETVSLDDEQRQHTGAHQEGDHVGRMEDVEHEGGG